MAFAYQHLAREAKGEYVRHMRATRYLYGSFSANSVGFCLLKRTLRRDLGGKHGCLVGIDGQICTLHGCRIKCNPLRPKAQMGNGQWRLDFNSSHKEQEGSHVD